MPRVELPSIPNRSVVLTDFGGVGDGVALNTDAFASAIAQLSQQGGGRLVVPAGIWRTGPIELKSHIELFVDKDAIVVFDPDQDLYPIIDTNFEGLDVRRCVSPLNATGAHDIAITGGGIFDGSGEYWREVKRRKVSAARSPTTNGTRSSSVAVTFRRTERPGSRTRVTPRRAPPRARSITRILPWTSRKSRPSSVPCSCPSATASASC